MEIRDGATEEELYDEKRKVLAEMDVLDGEIGSIKFQLAEAHRLKIETGKWADIGWWNRANSSLRVKGRQRQRLQAMQAEINRRIRALDGTDSEALLACLRNAGRARLGAEQWREIEGEAHRMLRERG